MSEAGSPMGPMGFPATNSDAEREGWRLLIVLLSIVVGGAVAFAVITFGLV
ncbi:MAG TPA: hypothetical protein VM327_04200 [Candidatus Thermoplasmatota archaeon]|nr:hypothetical protein [Candidatus Thermoplasmatota archaeon]